MDIAGYDPEAHAEKAVEELLADKELRNSQTGVTREVVSAVEGYFLLYSWELPC